LSFIVFTFTAKLVIFSEKNINYDLFFCRSSLHLLKTGEKLPFHYGFVKNIFDVRVNFN